MPISDDLRARIRATHRLLEEEGKPCGGRHIARYLRYERPVAITSEDEDAIFDAGWLAEVGKAIRGITTTAGIRTVLSAPGEEGRSYKQLSFCLLTDALGILQMYESTERAYRIQTRGWWQICERLRGAPEGTTVADLFPSEDRWERYWNAVRDSDLWEQAA